MLGQLLHYVIGSNRFLHHYRRIKHRFAVLFLERVGLEIIFLSIIKRFDLYPQALSALWLRVLFLLYSISISFGLDSKGYGVISKGYGVNSATYGDRTHLDKDT
jgi:hypothetical protein